MNGAVTQQAMLINLYYVLHTMRDAEEYWNGEKYRVLISEDFTN